jgi:hypothetical protein
MPDPPKKPEEVQRAAQDGISRGLKAEYDELTRAPLPPSFIGLLARFESAEFIRHIKARVERLRRGLKGTKR